MFRLIRLVVLLMIAFVAGIFFERNNQSEACDDFGGTRLGSGLCAIEGNGNV